jgi:DNA polymerase-1
MGQNITTFYDKQEVIKQYGLTPRQLIDLKALMGDSSDNIPGVSGIGEKTALALMQKYRSLDKIYEDIELMDQKPNVINKLKSGKEMAYLSRKLGEIDCNMPIDFNIDNFTIKQGFDQKAYEVFNKLEFKSLISKLELKPLELQQEVPNINLADKNNISSLLENINEDKSLNIFYCKMRLYSLLKMIFIYTFFRDQFFKTVLENRDIKKITMILKKIL